MKSALQIIGWTLGLAALSLLALSAAYAPMVVRCTRMADSWLAEAAKPLKPPPAALREVMYAELKDGDPASLVTRNLILTSGCSGWMGERGHDHIIDELVMISPLRAWFSRDELLTILLSRAYMGTKEGNRVYGFDNASWEYYGRKIGELEAPEFECLARKMRAPNSYRHRCNGH
jgi:Transglycosylase